MAREAHDQSVRDPLTRKLDELTERLAELDRQLADPEVLADPVRTRDASIRRAALAPVVERYGRYRKLVAEAEELREILAQPTDDVEYVRLAESELARVEPEARALLERIRKDLVMSEDRAVGSVILEVRAGVGGDEAMLWAGDLVEMYRRYAASQGWKVEDLGFAPGDVGGVRWAILGIAGEGVWARLGYEGGTHQVKRVPATEAQGRIHTSTATVAVLPEPREVELHLDPNDVEEHVTTSQGPGGQNVNKVATAVHLIHRPTGIEVRMQETKSQHQNRDKAWKLLRARLYELKRREAERERAEQRLAMIGSGDRAEKIRTYRYKENLVVDHRLGESFNLQATLAGDMDPLIEALIDQDTARRVAAL